MKKRRQTVFFYQYFCPALQRPHIHAILPPPTSSHRLTPFEVNLVVKRSCVQILFFLNEHKSWILFFIINMSSSYKKILKETLSCLIHEQRSGILISCVERLFHNCATENKTYGNQHLGTQIRLLDFQMRILAFLVSFLAVLVPEIGIFFLLFEGSKSARLFKFWL